MKTCKNLRKREKKRRIKRNDKYEMRGNERMVGRRGRTKESEKVEKNKHKRKNRMIEGREKDRRDKRRIKERKRE